MARTIRARTTFPALGALLAADCCSCSPRPASRPAAVSLRPTLRSPAIFRRPGPPGSRSASCRRLSPGRRAPHPHRADHALFPDSSPRRRSRRSALPAVAPAAPRRPPRRPSTSRDAGKLSLIRDQGGYGTCWAFASLASLESSLLPAAPTDYSENNMAHRSGFALGYDSGGNSFMAAAYLLRWDGPVTEADDPYAPTRPRRTRRPATRPSALTSTRSSTSQPARPRPTTPISSGRS